MTSISDDELAQMIAELPREAKEGDLAFEPSLGYPDEVRAEVTEYGIRVERCRPQWFTVATVELAWEEAAFISMYEIKAAADPEKLITTTLGEVQRRRQPPSAHADRVCRRSGVPKGGHAISP